MKNSNLNNNLINASFIYNQTLDKQVSSCDNRNVEVDYIGKKSHAFL